MSDSTTEKNLAQTSSGSKRGRDQGSPQAVSDSKKRAPFSGEMSVTQKDLDVLYEKLMVGVNASLKTELASFASKAEISELVAKFDGLARENAELRREMQSIKVENRQLKEAVDSLDLKLRKNNLVIRGLEAGRETDAKISVERFLEDIAGEGPAVKVSNAYLRGGRGGARPAILAELSSDQDVYRVLSRAGKLRGTGISITRDLPAEVRMRSNRMLRLRWEIRKIAPQTRMSLRTDKLWVNDKRLVWANDVLVADGGSAMDVLREATGADLSRTIADIVSYKRPPAQA
ncbi:Hypothetical protein NTJ_11331 [Nesidiocoris tenuis]|uniref:Uncharacterized protein n=1 Tax=Nesidiocoris tenuis TaxID=355587 RepID=A0ABN7B2N0_9HEMI|nr:Hypothetical protein NTJ_11331 [Nesidiocoris tenuis]